jgi:hypothetical protein
VSADKADHFLVFNDFRIQETTLNIPCALVSVSYLYIRTGRAVVLYVLVILAICLWAWALMKDPTVQVFLRRMHFKAHSHSSIDLVETAEFAMEVAGPAPKARRERRRRRRR